MHKIDNTNNATPEPTNALPFGIYHPEIAKYQFDSKNMLKNDAALLLDFFVQIYNKNKADGLLYDWFFCTESRIADRCNLSRKEAAAAVERLVQAKLITYDNKLSRNKRRFQFGRNIRIFYTKGANGKLSYNYTTNAVTPLEINDLFSQLYQKGTTNSETALNNNGLNVQLCQNGTTNDASTIEPNELGAEMLQNGTSTGVCSYTNEQGVQLYQKGTTKTVQLYQKGTTHIKETSIIKETKEKCSNRNLNTFEQNEHLEGSNSNNCKTENINLHPSPNSAAPLPMLQSIPVEWWLSLRLTQDQTAELQNIYSSTQHLLTGKPDEFKFFYCAYSATIGFTENIAAVWSAFLNIYGTGADFVRAFIQCYVSGTIPQHTPIVEFIQSYKPTTPKASTQPPKASTQRKSNQKVVTVDPYEKDKMFVELWGMYPRKDNKKRAFSAWNKLSKANKQAAKDGMPNFLQHHPDTKFLPMLATYLNGERWADEYTATKQPQPTPTNKIKLLN